MTKDMTQGSPLKLILAFAVPLMLGSLFQQFYNLADTIIVGRFVGVEALAAVGSVGGLNYLVLGFVNGIACGFSIPISWTFGAKDYKEMRRYTANTVWLSIFFAVVLTIVTVALTRSVLVWTNTPENIIDLADIYIRTIFAGIPFTLLYNVTSALMRALGDSKRPLYFLLVASVLNIGLDLACIILFNMGVFGAAFATVFSQAVAGIGSLIYIMRHYPELRWNKEEGRISAPHCAKLCAMGLPMGLQCSITAIGSVVLLILPLSLVTIALFYRHVTRPMEVLGQAYQLVKSGERGYEIGQKAPNREFEKLFDQFNAMSAELQRQFERAYLEQQATQQANIKALQSQINPHFLNNTLEIINWEARMADNERVSAMIESLSTMLKAALDRNGRTKIPLSEELGYVDAYLYIIRERLGEGFRVHKDIDESILALPVPRLVLQPLVENAVEHDITANRGGDLWVRAYRQTDKVVLEVEHDGTLTQEDRQKIQSLLAQSAQGAAAGGQVGLRNVSQRLNLIYGDKGTLTLDQTRAGTVLARVAIPAGQ